MKKLTASAKRLQRNRVYAMAQRNRLKRALAKQEAAIAHAKSIADKGGLERKSDVHHPREVE